MIRFTGPVAISLAVLFSSGCGSPSTRDGASPAEYASTSPSLRYKIEKLGQAFKYRQTFSNTPDVVDWEVTVTKVECGIQVFKNGFDNPEYTSGKWSSDNVPPTHIDATPPSGQSFCRMDATQKNVGTKPASGTASFDNLVTDKGEFEASMNDERIADNLMEIEKVPSGPFNPGATAKVIKIWPVPAEAKPLAVLFPITNVYSGPTHRIEIA